MVRPTLIAFAIASLSATTARADEKMDILHKVGSTEVVTSLTDILPGSQQIAFRNKDTGCMFVGAVHFDGPSRTWTMPIDRQVCATWTAEVYARVIPSPSTQGTTLSGDGPLLRAGEGAVLVWQSLAAKTSN